MASLRNSYPSCYVLVLILYQLLYELDLVKHHYTSPKYALCQAPQPTASHILTRCSVTLDQGRYTWRHDSVLQVLIHGLQQHLPDSFNLYADLPGYLASVCPPSTIPINLPPPLALVLVSNDSICLFKLTIPTNTQQHLLAARARKEDRYSCL